MVRTILRCFNSVIFRIPAFTNAIPKGWIPWPFSALIFGKPIKSNKNRGSGSEYDSAGGGYDSGGGGDGGGDD